MVKKIKKDICFRFGLKPQQGNIFAVYALVPEGDEQKVMETDFYAASIEQDDYMRLVMASTAFKELIEIDRIAARDWNGRFFSSTGMETGVETVTVDLGDGTTEEQIITVLNPGLHQKELSRTSREWMSTGLGGLSNYLYVDKDKNLIYRYIKGERQLNISWRDYIEDDNGYLVRVGNVYNCSDTKNFRVKEKAFIKKNKYQEEEDERDLNIVFSSSASWELNYSEGWNGTVIFNAGSTTGKMALSPMGAVLMQLSTSSKNYEDRDVWTPAYKTQKDLSEWTTEPRRILPEIENAEIHLNYFKGWEESLANGTILKANDKDDYLISLPYKENISSLLLIDGQEYILPEERYEIEGQTYVVNNYVNYFSAQGMLSFFPGKEVSGPYVFVTLDAGTPAEREAGGDVRSIVDGNVWVYDFYNNTGWVYVKGFASMPHRFTEPEIIYREKILSGWFFNGSEADEPKGYMISSWFGDFIYKIRIDELIPESDFAEALMYGVDHPINQGSDLLTQRMTAKNTLETRFGFKASTFVFDVLERIKDDTTRNENNDTKLEEFAKLMNDIQGLPAYLKIYDPKTTTLWVEKYEIVENGTGKRIIFKERFQNPFVVPLKNRKKVLRDWDYDTIHDMESLLRSICYVPYD